MTNTRAMLLAFWTIGTLDTVIGFHLGPPLVRTRHGCSQIRDILAVDGGCSQAGRHGRRMGRDDREDGNDRHGGESQGQGCFNVDECLHDSVRS